MLFPRGAWCWGLLSANDMVLVAEGGAELGQKLHPRVVERNEKGSGVDVAETDVAAGDGA